MLVMLNICLWIQLGTHWYHQDEPRSVYLLTLSEPCFALHSIITHKWLFVKIMVCVWNQEQRLQEGEMVGAKSACTYHTEFIIYLSLTPVFRLG